MIIITFIYHIMYTKVKNCLKYNKKSLSIICVQLNYMVHVPYNISKLICYANILSKLPHLPLCKELLCGNNKILKLPDLPFCKSLICDKTVKPGLLKTNCIITKI